MKLLARIRHLVHRPRFERDLEEELRIHREMTEDRLAREGFARTEAHHAARRSFGNTAQTLENSRAVWTFAGLETLLQDLRYAIRGFRRSPGFALTVVATIAFGLGLNTALFTLFNAYSLRPIAMRDPHSVYEFSWRDAKGQTLPLKWRDYELIRKDAPAFSDALAEASPIGTRINDQPVFGMLVSGNFFDMLGVSVAMGRPLTPADTAAPGLQPVVVLSHRAWKNKFGSDRAIIGKKLFIRGYPFEVVGVTTPGFPGFSGRQVDYWAPITMAGAAQVPDPFHAGQPAGLRAVIGRLKPGWDAARAHAALLTWSRQVTADRPQDARPMQVRLLSRATTIPLSLELIAFFTPTFAAFALVLLAACANVANMMLARALSRQREIGIRLSLGAARSRLIRQLLTESIVLAIPAAGAGFAVSQAALRYGQDLMFATLPPEFAKYVSIPPLPPDLRVFGFMLAAALAASLLFGLVPALEVTRASVVQAARGDFSSEYRPGRLRSGLVVTQIAICALLLIVAGVLLRSGVRLENLDVGLRTQNVIAMEVLWRLRADVIRHLASEPLVESVAAAVRPPLAQVLMTMSFSPDGGKTWAPGSYNLVSPEFFEILSVPILRGRNFTVDEARGEAPVAILNETAARSLFPDADPLARSIRLVSDLPAANSKQPRHRSAQVIGIVRDAVYSWPAEGKQISTMFFPMDPRESRSLLIRVKGDADTSRQRMSARLAAATGAIEVMSSLDDVLAVSLYPFRAAYFISCAVGVLALLLTLSGVYGVLSYVVSQRTKEIGIRMALGATPVGVIAMVLRQLMRMSAIGIALGGILALGVSRLFSAHLPMMNMYDSAAFIGGALLVFLASMAAAYMPSRRASRVDPVTTLSCD
ncbi:MAG: ADOP family duplicated permease [Bryobacteraceae bacterium]